MYNKPNRGGWGKWDTNEVETTMVEIMPQARKVFKKVCDIEQLRKEILRDVDLLTAMSTQPPDPVAVHSMVITTTKIKKAPSKTCKSLFLFQIGFR